jgi:glycosyltransferase involved in cell wall biosynthesis
MIGTVLRGLRQEYQNIVVVDDGSSDATVREAASAGATVLTHPINIGQGAALQTGITYARLRNAARVVTFDADGQHTPEDIAAMIAIQDQLGVDCVLGSRFLGHAVNMPRSKRLTLKAAVLFERLTTGMRVTDAHNGLRLLNRNAIAKISLRQNRMAHASELLSQIRQHRLTYAEAPVTIRYSEYSVQKGQKASNAVNIVVELIFGKLGH